MKNAYKILVGKREGMKPFGNRSWKDNVKMDLKEIVFGMLF
jgi:hypothetical protein